MRRYSLALHAAWELQGVAGGTSEFAALGDTTPSRIRTIRSGTGGFSSGEPDHGHPTSGGKLRCRPAARPSLLYHPQVLGIGGLGYEALSGTPDGSQLRAPDGSRPP